MNEPHEAIISIVNHGFSDLVMEAAKSAGATGGTVISGHGTGNKDIEQFFEKKVFLELYVKVEDDWRNREQLLRQFGYIE